MKDTDKIAVYYIATGIYKKLFPEFLKSLHNLFPNNMKIVKLISDGLEEYDNYKEDNIIVELCPRINNYPWPIVALYKMWHILENFDDSCEYSCYFNGNSIINPHSDDVFDFNKITVSYHSFNSKNKTYDPWPYININKLSSAYLENGTYDYIQSGFFFGPSYLIKTMCSEVVDLLKYDTCRYMFAQWHDESYLNKWVVLNRDKVDIKYIMTVYKQDVDNYRFIFIREKKDYGIKK